MTWPRCFGDPQRSDLRSRRAFTLIEVMLGAVLLSTLVVSGIHGLRLHQRQLQFNEHRIEAVGIADRKLAFLSHLPDGVPIAASEVIDAERQWFWRTQLVGVQAVFGQPTLVVRFEIIENLPTPGTVLVAVDFIKPAPSVVQPLMNGPESPGPTNAPETPQPEMVSP